MLSEKEIAEIEESYEWRKDGVVGKLLATVKELRKENTEQRELLRKCKGRVRHAWNCPALSDNGIYFYECQCDQKELQRQIEEKVK